MTTEAAPEAPATPIGKWLRDHGKTVSDLMRGAGVSWITARDYVSGKKTTRADYAVATRISEWTGGAVSVDDLMSARRKSTEAA